MQNLIYEWVNFSRFSQIWAKIGSNIGKFRWFCSKLGQLVCEWVTFSWKIGICMSLLSNSLVAHPYPNQTWVPQGTHTDRYYTHILHNSSHNSYTQLSTKPCVAVPWSEKEWIIKIENNKQSTGFPKIKGPFLKMLLILTKFKNAQNWDWFVEIYTCKDKISNIKRGN